MSNIMLFLFVVAPLGILVHECGHLLIAILMRVRECKIHLGVGPVLYSGSRVTVRLAFFMGGTTEYSVSEDPSMRGKVALISLGGPLSNLLCYWLIQQWITSYHIESILPTYFLMFNLWLAVMNVIPVKLGQIRSDGWLFFHNLYAFLKKKER
ncbi:hypothetical protein LOK74_15815 [Brevibacillus humidisoli]|uniref:site-2 protease family protein n=1 Tax=Brevibacillus humidisoli TaxID=2895522 RepID=UPI001E35DA3A|nr:site-2 protease family protein [Brevibacillus humidisoli]UFJ39516.1 hypothetical protein LOK74_15815 [Brevibacillus humidisoli]